jgi:hypothetical protein
MCPWDKSYSDPSHPHRGISPEQAVDDAITRIPQILSEELQHPNRLRVREQQYPGQLLVEACRPRAPAATAAPMHKPDRQVQSPLPGRLIQL